MDRSFKQEPEIFSIGVDETAKNYLRETARWTKFMAIFFFVVSALMLALGILAVLVTGGGDGDDPLTLSWGGGITVVLYVVFFCIYAYPTWALYKFSRLTNAAMQTSNQQQFNDALKYQKIMYKYLGVLLIIVLALYTVAIVFRMLADYMSGDL